MNHWKPQDTIGRIQQMELYFDTVQRAVMLGYDAVCRDALIAEMLGVLTEYYENGQWLADYQRDECGELPPALKRGVLSQDGLYDLLCEVDRLREKGQ